MKRNLQKYFLLSFVIVLLLTGCSKKTDTYKKEYTDAETLYVGTPIHNGLYNHLYAATAYDEDVCNLIYESLVESTPEGVTQVNKRLVEDFSISEDGKVYTFQLRKGIKFSNGKSLTAEDVVFTYQTLGDPSSTAYRHQWIADLQGGTEYMEGTTTDFTGVVAKDKYTVEFLFVSNRRNNLQRCSVKILSKNYYPEWEQGNADFPMHEKMNAPMGSGPYILTEYKPNEQVVLQKNPKYWADKETDYRIPQIVIQFIPNGEKVLALKDGRVDFIPQITDQKSIDELRNWQYSLEQPNINVQIFQRNSYGYVGFHTANGATKDIVLRQAIAYAFDDERFVKEYLGELGEPITAPIPSSSDLYDLIVNDMNFYDYNIDTAKKLLTENGYTGVGEHLLDSQGKPVSVVFLATKDNQTLKALLPKLKESTDALGIDLQVEEVSFTDLVKRIQGENNDWNMFFMADDWHANDPDQWGLYFSSDAIPKTNVTRYHNEQVDEWLKLGSQYTDILSEETIAIYKNVLLQINKDLPELPIYTGNAISVANNTVKDWNVTTYQRWSEGLEGTYLEKEEA